MFIAFLVIARSSCFSIECILAVSSLLVKVVIASDVVLGDVIAVLGGAVVVGLGGAVAVLEGVVAGLGGAVAGLGGAVAGLGSAAAGLGGVAASLGGAVAGLRGAVASLGGVAGEDGSDDMALTDINRLEVALMESKVSIQAHMNMRLRCH
jgi:hypothetical protein